MKYRNVRNMKNLYEEKSQQCKNVDVQDQMNLGLKKLWVRGIELSQLPPLTSSTIKTH
jgi:hypothetical protein